MPRATGQVKQEHVDGYVEHPYMWFPDGNMTLKAKNPEQVFRIHGYLFERESDESRALITQLNEEPVGIIELDGVDSTELEDFLRVLYTPPLQEPSIEGLAAWTHVLKLSTLWNFAHLRTHAISRMLHLTKKTIHRVLLAHQYNVEEWLRDGYLRICEQSTLPNNKNIEKLGHAVFVKMVRAREKLAKDVEPRSRPEKIYLIEDIFGLPHIPYVEDPLHQSPLDIDTPAQVTDETPLSVPAKSKKRPKPSSTVNEEPRDQSAPQPIESATPKGRPPHAKKKKSVPNSAAPHQTHAQSVIAQPSYYEEEEDWHEYAPEHHVYYQPHSQPHANHGRGMGRGRPRGAGRGRGSGHMHPLPPKPIAMPSNPPPGTYRGGSSTRVRGRGGLRARPYQGRHT